MTSNQVTKSIIVKGDLPDLYETWADFSKFPQFMDNLISVTPDGPDTHHWVREGPLNTTLEWTTKTTRLEPHRRIAWKTLEGDFKTSGQVTFTDLPHGEVEVTVTSQIIPSDNISGKVAIWLWDEEAQLQNDLRNFKALIENRVRTTAS